MLLLGSAHETVASVRKLVVATHFEKLATRRGVLNRFFELAKTHGVGDAAVVRVKRSKSPYSLGIKARRIFKKQAKLGEIDFRDLNMEGSHRRDWVLPAQIVPSIEPTCCIVDIVWTVRCGDAESEVRKPTPATLKDARAGVHDDYCYLYLYYAPQPGERLNPAEAKRLYSQIVQSMTAVRQDERIVAAQSFE